jgi:polysaccharide export outer membrane protein
VGDVLSITFFYYPRYNVLVTVRPDGMVTVPLLGEVRAEGVRPAELESLIRSRYAEVVAEPEVAVIVAEFADQRVFVFGEVNKPGMYPLMGAMTLIDAIAQAGGIATTGKSGSVILMRRSETGEYAGQKVDIASVLESENSQSIRLMPIDIVYVPMKAIAKVDLFVEQFFKDLTPAMLFYMYGRDIVTKDGEVIIGR